MVMRVMVIAMSTPPPGTGPGGGAEGKGRRNGRAGFMGMLEDIQACRQASGRTRRARGRARRRTEERAKERAGRAQAARLSLIHI